MSDIVCKKHSAGETSVAHKKWYLVYLGDVFLGQVVELNGWNAICETNCQFNWMARGFATRRRAIEFILRQAGYWQKD